MLYEWHRTGELSGIAEITADPSLPSVVDVYSIDGRLVRPKVAKTAALDGLARGVYIVGNRKVAI